MGAYPLITAVATKKHLMPQVVPRRSHDHVVMIITVPRALSVTFWALQMTRVFEMLISSPLIFLYYRLLPGQDLGRAVTHCPGVW